MYKDVVKRVIAFLLIFCMIGTMQDYSLLARTITEEGAQHTYADDIGAVAPSPLANGEYFANAFTIEANNDTAKNVQVLKSVSFALDANLHNGDITKYVKTATYTVKVYKYTNSPLDVITGTADASVTGTYDIDTMGGNESVTVNFDASATYSGADSFLAFSAGEKYVVKVEITNAVVFDDGGKQQPAGTSFHVKTAVSPDSTSYINGNYQNGKTVCIQAVTAEAFVEEPLTGLAFTDSGISLKVGEKKTIGVEYQPATTSQKTLKWSSSNTAVASVNEDTGEITALSQGAVDITAVSDANSDISVTTTITICKNIGDPASGIKVSEISPQTYTGAQLKPTFSVRDETANLDLVKDTHYTVSYGGNENAGNGAGTAVIQGAGNGYLGEKPITFDILPVDIGISSGFTVALTNPNDPKFTYDGSAVTLTGTDLTVKFNNKTLTEGTHYRIKEHGNNAIAGNSAYVILEGIAGTNYTGTKKFPFAIKKSITDPTVKVKLNNYDEGTLAFTYSRSERKPAVTLTDTLNSATAPNMKPDRDYKLTWNATPNYYTDAGTKEIVITGVDAYYTESNDIPPVPVTRTVTFEIIRRSIKPGNGVKISAIPNQIAGAANVTGLKLTYNDYTLLENTDYTVSRHDNPADRTTTITIEGINNYQEKVEQTVPMGIDISKNSDGTPSDVRINQNLVYTGGKIEPTVELYIDNSLVDPGSYDVAYDNNTEARNAAAADAPYVKITGKGIYAGEIITKFTIKKKNIVTFDEDTNFQYQKSVEFVKSAGTQTGIKTPLSITYGKVLTEGTASDPKDYIVTYSDNTRATDERRPAKMTIVGQGNFEGTVELEYQITRKKISELTFEIDGAPYTDADAISYPYTGEKIEPTVKVFQNGVELEKNVDYKLKYGDDNINVSTNNAYVMVVATGEGEVIGGQTGSGNYQLNKTLGFKIDKCDISSVLVSTIQPQDYTGEQIKIFEGAAAPTVSVPISMKQLTADDFDVTYSGNIEAGVATATLHGKGLNFTGTKNNVTFKIVKDINTAFTTAPKSIKVNDITDQKYAGIPIEPIPTVTDLRLSDPDRPYELKNGDDFEIDSWEDNDKVGTATIVIKGKDCYKGTIRKTFKIIQNSLQDPGIQASLVDMDMTFTGSPVTPDVVVTYNGRTLVKGASEDYTITHSNPTNVNDDSKVIVEGAKNFGGTIEVPYRIKQKNLEDSSIKIGFVGGTGTGNNEFNYGGADGARPKVEIIDRNRDVNTGERVNVGTGGYVLRSGDYRIRYYNNTSVTDDAYATIEGRSNYYTTEPIKLPFKIKKVALTSSNTTIDLGAASYVYTGKAIAPHPAVIYTNDDGDDITLYDGTDFVVDTTTTGGVVKEAKNVADGTMTYQIRGIGNYEGTVAADAGDTFTITPKPIDAANVLVDPIPNQGHTGSPVEPSASVKITYNGITLAAPADYTLGYSNNTNADTDDTPLADQPAVIITGTGNYTNSRTENFHIRTNMDRVSASLTKDIYTYTSQPIYPQPQVTRNGVPLEKDVDYELKYKNNTNSTLLAEGNAVSSVVVQGKGKYGGSKTLTFKIVPVDMADRTAPIALEVRKAEFTGSTVNPEYDFVYTPNPSIRYVLQKTIDYTQTSVTGQNVGDVGGITIMPYGRRGNFMSGADGMGSAVTFKYNITARDITNNPDIIAVIEDATFDGSPVVPVVSIKDKKRKSTGEAQGTTPNSTAYAFQRGDYDITYTPNLIGPGEVTAHITGKGNYKGTAEAKFKIKGNFANATVTLGSAVYAGGDEVKPTVKATYNNGAITLQENVDYKCQYFNNKNSGVGAYVLVEGINSYAGYTHNIPFTIAQKDIKDGIEVKKDMTLTGIFDTYTWDGTQIKPTPTITYGRHNLSLNTDFECTYDADSSTLGEHTITIAAKPNGNYKGSVTRKYVIGSNFNVRVTLEKNSYVYTRGEIRPRVTVTDNITNEVLSLEDGDYGVQYQGNENVGTATVHVYGMGAPYMGNMSVNFQITGKELGDSDIQIANVDGITYTGSAITPEPAVRWNQGGDAEEEKLTDTDFVYTYGENTKGGKGTITIVPAENSNYIGKQVKEFDINKKDIGAENSGVTVEPIDPQYYTASDICPVPVVKWGDIVLTTDDYTPIYEKNRTVGEAKLTIKGKSPNYTGDIVVYFQIEKRPIDGMTIKYQQDWQYTGDDITPPLDISFLDDKGKTVKLGGSDYKFTYDRNKNAGEGVINIVADEVNYSGDAEMNFTIKPRSIKTDNTVKMSEVKSQVLNSEGKAEPKPVLTFMPNGASGKKYILEEGLDKDYTLEYQNNTTVGQTGTVIVHARQGGNFTDDTSADFYVGDDVKKYIDASINPDDISNLVYNGKPQKPAVTVTQKGNQDLVENTDYKIVYDEDCTSAGEHTVSVEGIQPYGGSIDMTYTIAKREISNAEFDILPQTFNGSAIHPLIVGMDTDAMTVLGEDSSTAAVTGDIDKDGMLTNLDAFTTAITDNVNHGEAKVTITATNHENSNYTGTTTASFIIQEQDIASDYISSTRPLDQIYTGNPLSPEITLTDTRRNPDGTAKLTKGGEDYILKFNQDYRIISRENTYPGTAFMNVEGMGNYNNFFTKTFTITADLSNAVIQAIPDQAYTGGAICPELTVTLGQRKLTKVLDYNVNYIGNIDRGTATAIISSGENNLYTGSKSITFNISRDISQAKVTMIGSSFTYTGEAITPAVAVENDGQRLEYGKDYTVSYANNVNVGTAVITITGAGAYSGSIQGGFGIIKKSIIRCDFNELISQLYTGAPTTQTIYVADGMSMLLENRDYTVKYVNNTSPGTATVTITGNGNYGGVKTIRYNIEVPNMSSAKAIASTSSIKVSWDQVGGVTGYEIYDTKNKLVGKTTSTSFTKKKLKKLTTYSYKVRPYVTADGATYYGGFSNTITATTVPSKPSIKLSAGSKSIKVTWKKIKSVSGYEIYRSTSKKGAYKKIKTITKSSTVSYTNKKLKSKKTYYYKVRSYKTVKGKKVYSSYSSMKSTRAK